MKRQTITVIAAAAGMTVLILDGQTALEAAREGIQLCVQTLIPSLLPFFIFSVMLTGSLSGSQIKLMRPLEKLCRIPEGTGSILAIGLLGGYPVGAQNVYLAWKNGQITRFDAERMLGFCNNAGPAFLFGVIGSTFSNPLYPWLLWGIHVISALAVGMLLPGKPDSMVRVPERQIMTLPQALEKSLRVMASVCGWVVFFRLILGFLDRWILWLFPISLQVTVKGLLELSNGCVLLEDIPSIGLRFTVASVMLGFGGLCVAMQTRSVCEGLSLRTYHWGKALQTLISFFLACLAGCVFPAEDRIAVHPVIFAAAAALICLVWMKRRKKAVAFRRRLVYNR